MGFARNFWKASPVGWLAALPWPFITEACRALWCRWWHCKRSIDVGDGNYPAALLHKIDPWTFCLPSCCCKKRVFFFFGLLVCGFLQNLLCHSFKLLKVYHLPFGGLGFVYFFCKLNNFTHGAGLNFFDFHPDTWGNAQNLTNSFQTGWNHHLV